MLRQCPLPLTLGCCLVPCVATENQRVGSITDRNAPAASSERREVPATSNTNIVGHALDFVPSNEHLFFSPVSRTWREAWRLLSPRPTITSLIRRSPSCRTQLALAAPGNVAVLKWARENGCKWDETACSEAAKRGFLNVLQWLRANGCPWSRLTCSAAASGGHSEVLRWARNNGCSWRATSYAEASMCGRLAVLQLTSERAFLLFCWVVAVREKSVGLAIHDDVENFSDGGGGRHLDDPPSEDRMTAPQATGRE